MLEINDVVLYCIVLDVRSLAVDLESHKRNEEYNGLNNEPNCRLDRLSAQTACASFQA